MSGRRSLEACPYKDCGSNILPSTDGEKQRPKAYELVRCTSSLCGGYAIRKLNGFVYPMEDRTNPDSDPLVMSR